jgi:hypothetical protein
MIQGDIKRRKSTLGGWQSRAASARQMAPFAAEHGAQ